jgi:hypothetical protein
MVTATAEHKSTPADPAVAYEGIFAFSENVFILIIM